MTGITGWRPDASGAVPKALRALPSNRSRSPCRPCRPWSSRRRGSAGSRPDRAREHVGGLGHEVDAAEDDGFGLGASLGGVRELEGVADEVGVLDDFVALIEVAEDDEAVAQGVPLRRGCGGRVRSLRPGGTPAEGSLVGRAGREGVCMEAPGP